MKNFRWAKDGYGSHNAILWIQPAGAKVSEGVRDSFWLQAMMAGFKSVIDCIKAFSETDFSDDLKKIDVPTLIMHGDDDQIVPIGASAMLSSKIVKNAQLKIYKGAPHGLCTTHKNRSTRICSHSSSRRRTTQWPRTDPSRRAMGSTGEKNQRYT